MASPNPDRQALTPSTAHLDIDAIRTGVHDLPVEVGYQPELASTNAALRTRTDLHHGLVLFTDFQSAGKGRKGRSWTAPARSSLLGSVALAVPDTASPPAIVMLAALSVADTVEEVTGLPVELKWPNDVLLSGKKLCGILVELKGSIAITGIGLNVNITPETIAQLSPVATSLLIETGRSWSRETLAVALLKRLDLWYGVFTHEPDAVFRAWRARLTTLGRPILVEDASGQWRGVARGAGQDGGLTVEAEDGTTRIVYAADVSVRQSAD